MWPAAAAVRAGWLTTGRPASGARRHPPSAISLDAAARGSKMTDLGGIAVAAPAGASAAGFRGMRPTRPGGEAAEGGRRLLDARPEVRGALKLDVDWVTNLTTGASVVIEDSPRHGEARAPGTAMADGCQPLPVPPAARLAGSPIPRLEAVPPSGGCSAGRRRSWTRGLQDTAPVLKVEDSDPLSREYSSTPSTRARRRTLDRLRMQPQALSNLGRR